MALIEMDFASSGDSNSLTEVEIATDNSLQGHSYDVKSLLPNYRELTIDNFVIKNTTMTAASASYSRTNNLIQSYDASTGTLTTNAVAYTMEVYMFYLTYTIVAVF